MQAYATLLQQDSVHVLFGFGNTLMNIRVVIGDLLPEARNIFQKELIVYRTVLKQSSLLPIATLSKHVGKN